MAPKEKVRLDISPPGAYLTGLPNVLAALGLPSDLAAIFIKLHTFSGKDLVPGESTLRRARLHGYSKSTIEKLTKPFDINPEEIEFSKKETQLFERAAKVRSPMPQWWGLKSFLNETPEFRLLWQFIEQRIYNDIVIREVALSGQSSSNIRDPIVKLELERISHLMQESFCYQENLTERRLDRLSCVASEMDFYFCLFVHFELGFKKQFAFNGGRALRRSAIAQTIQGRASEEARTCFEAFLDLLREALGEPSDEGKISWHELAKHIEQPQPSCGSTETVKMRMLRLRDEEKRIKDQQYGIIKQWRRGDEGCLPGNDKLIKFFKSATGGSEDLEYLFLQAKIAMFLDKKLAEWNEAFNESSLPPFAPLARTAIWARAYDRYWESCLNEYWPSTVELQQ